MTALHANKLFSRLAETEWARLEAVTTELSFSAGETIFKEGDPGEAVYVVKSGSVQISAVVEAGERHILSKIGAGEIFGEMAVLENKPRSATASAESDVSLYRIPREEMIELLRRSPDFALALIHDISHRLREFNRHYIRNVLQVERLSVIGRFASSIVHDLKNPLSAINMAASMACAETAKPETRKIARERIYKQVDRVTHLVNDILEFTSGKKSGVDLVPTDYADFVRGIMDEFRQDLQQNDLLLEFENAPPAVKVALNPKRLHRVFYNLIGNAIDAMPAKGTIALRFSREAGRVTTEIEDSGKGLAPEILGRLFEPFATHGKAKGTGLGLSICQWIIEEHGGAISAHNSSRGGAVFRFWLPVAD